MKNLMEKDSENASAWLFDLLILSKLLLKLTRVRVHVHECVSVADEARMCVLKTCFKFTCPFENVSTVNVYSVCGGM